MSRIAVLIFIIALVPALAFAREPSGARYVYPNVSVFAWNGTTCPNGSGVIHDPVYVAAGHLSGIIYCLFPVPEIAVEPNGFCPTGFKRTSADRCFDQRSKP